MLSLGAPADTPGAQLGAQPFCASSPSRMTPAAAEFLAGTGNIGQTRAPEMAAGIGSHRTAPGEGVSLRAVWLPVIILQKTLEVDKGAVVTASGAYLGLTVCSSLYFNIVKGDLQL